MGFVCSLQPIQVVCAANMGEEYATILALKSGINATHYYWLLSKSLQFVGIIRASSACGVNLDLPTFCALGVVRTLLVSVFFPVEKLSW